MEKETFQLNELIEYPKSGILSKVLLKSDTKDVTLFCMSKGSELSEHTSTKEGFVHVLEGNGTFVLKGKKISMNKGVLIHMEKKAVHSLKANKNMAFLLILSN
ncbi:MAG: cupin domain-containing protein [archaeon]|jgi:nitric oxide dioxygenase